MPAAHRQGGNSPAECSECKTRTDSANVRGNDETRSRLEYPTSYLRTRVEDAKDHFQDGNRRPVHSPLAESHPITPDTSWESPCPERHLSVESRFSVTSTASSASSATLTAPSAARGPRFKVGSFEKEWWKVDPCSVVVIANSERDEKKTYEDRSNWRVVTW